MKYRFLLLAVFAAAIPFYTKSASHLNIESSSVEQQVETKDRESVGKEEANLTQAVEQSFDPSATKALADALETKNLEKAREIVKSGKADLNKPTVKEGLSERESLVPPLYLAVILNDADLVKELLANGASQSISYAEGGLTPLHRAVTIGGWQENRKERLPSILAIIDMMVAQNPETLNFRSLDGSTPLHSAIASGLLEESKRLIDLGAPLDAEDRNRLKPLEYAKNQEKIYRRNLKNLSSFIKFDPTNANLKKDYERVVRIQNSLPAIIDYLKKQLLNRVSKIGSAIQTSLGNTATLPSGIASLIQRLEF